jgi:uncharacterized protein YqhQ
VTDKPFSVGGQALIEGVMMKTPHKVAAAARTPDGKIVRTKKRYVTRTERSWFYRLPIIRGIVSLGEMLVVGIKMLNWSADQQAGTNEKMSAWETSLALILSLGLTVALFIIAPYWLARLLTETRGTVFNLIDGLARIVIFVAYVWAIGLFSDVKRMYQYHGAEHMTVHCHEAGKALKPENVRKYSPVHPRCGTSLLMFVIIVSILIFSLVKDPRWYVNVPLRVMLVPIVAGISYELLKLSARWPRNLILRWMMLPGLWVQKITTKVPAKDQIQVAIVALEEAL